LNKFLKEICLIKDSNIYVLDQENKMLLKYAPNIITEKLLKRIIKKTNLQKTSFFQIDYDGTKWVLFSISSDENWWKYVSFVSFDSFFSQIKRIRLYLFIYLVLAIVLGVFMILYLSYKNYKPIQELKQIMLSKLSNSKNNIFINSLGEYSIIDKNEYEVLKNLTDLFLKQEDYIFNQLKKFTPVLQNSFFMRLLIGDIENVTQEYLQLLRISFISDKFLTVLLEPYDCSKFIKDESEKEYNLVSFIIFNVFDELFNNKGYKSFDVVISKKRLVIILNVDDKTTENQIVSILEEGKIFLQSNFSIFLTIGLSTINEGLINVKKCYKEAEKALNMQFIYGNIKIFTYNEEIYNNNIKNEYIVSQELEEQLLSFIKEGDVDNVNNFLDKIYHNYFLKEEISPLNKRLLCEQLLIFYYKVCKLITITPSDELITLIESNFQNVEVNKEIKDIIAIFKKAFTDICDHVKQSKNSFSTILIEKILKFISQEYTNPNISLTLIADRFSITPQYLSSFFKEKTGINLSEYIINLRISKSKELLLTSSYSINEISIMVGYNHISSFIKAFKKIEGISPNRFRELSKGE